MEISFTAGGADPVAIVVGATEKGLALAAEYVLQQTNEVVPIEEHTLQESGKASVDGNTLTAAVSYDTEYAVPVHEDLTARHDTGRHAKYLEKTMNDSGEAVGEIIAKTIRGEL